jgi:hypothetical protein
MPDGVAAEAVETAITDSSPETRTSEAHRATRRRNS